jgi:hypothetical protein
MSASVKAAEPSARTSLLTVTPSHSSTIAVRTSWSISSTMRSTVEGMELEVDEQGYDRRVELAVFARAAVQGGWNKEAIPRLRELLSMRPAGFIKTVSSYNTQPVDSVQVLRNQVPVDLPHLPEHERLCRLRDALLADAESLGNHAWSARVSVAELVPYVAHNHEDEKQVHLVQLDMTRRPGTRLLGVTLRKPVFVVTYHVAEIEYV